MLPLATTVLLLFPLVCLSMELTIQVYYPTNNIRHLPDHSIFSLKLCHTPGCPSTSPWNQSIPGLPYDPKLTITSSDYTGSNNLYVKRVTIPTVASSSSAVHLTIAACFDPPGNPFGNASIIGYCDNGALDPVGNDCMHVGMPYRSKPTTSPGHALITAYPYFQMVSGTVSTLLPNLLSPQLHNRRDINVYMPASLLQNTVRRKVNVLVVNDGTLFFLRQLAFVGGFDVNVLTGAVPETILIGLPQPPTGCERQYELTFSTSTQNSCQPKATYNRSVQSGGNDQYLDFVQHTVVPQVMQQQNLDVGEVAITGASYGGLTSCYAASARPQYFQRAFCQSPSVWWNYGELPHVIKTNAQQWGLPTAIVMYIGTTEMELPLPTSPKHTDTNSWYSYVDATAKAWLAAGLGEGLHVFTLSGGYHDATAWATVFGTGVIQMYVKSFFCVDVWMCGCVGV